MSQKKSPNAAKKELTDLLLKMRSERKLSLRQVAYKTGMSSTYISQLERGIASTPSPETIKKLADAYKLDYENLLIKAGYIEQKENTNDPYEILMFSDKEAFDSLPEEERERILTSLRDQADYLIDRATKGR